MSIQVEGMVPLLAVFDVPTALAFYRDVLGFEVLNSSKPFSGAKDDFGWALLRLHGVDLMLNNAYEDNIRPVAMDAARISAHGDTILYFACPDVDATFAKLRGQGVAVTEPTVAYYGMRQINVVDPDGYRCAFSGRSNNRLSYSGGLAYRIQKFHLSH